MWHERCQYVHKLVLIMISKLLKGKHKERVAKKLADNASFVN